jgi:hypothetical protein
MGRSHGIVIAAALLLCLALCAGLFTFVITPDGRHRLATLGVDDSRHIEITKSILHDRAAGVYYEVFVDGRSQGHRDFCGATQVSASALAFDLLRGDGGDLVAVVERSSPDIVLVLYRVSTGKAVANGWGTEIDAELAVLQASYPDRTLIRRGDVEEPGGKVK